MAWPSQQDLTSFDTGLWGQEGMRSAHLQPLTLQVFPLTFSSTSVGGQVRSGPPRIPQWSGCLRNVDADWRRAADWTGPLQSPLLSAHCSCKVGVV